MRSVARSLDERAQNPCQPRVGCAGCAQCHATTCVRNTIVDLDTAITWNNSTTTIKTTTTTTTPITTTRKYLVVIPIGLHYYRRVPTMRCETAAKSRIPALRTAQALSATASTDTPSATAHGDKPPPQLSSPLSSSSYGALVVTISALPVG